MEIWGFVLNLLRFFCKGLLLLMRFIDVFVINGFFIFVIVLKLILLNGKGVGRLEIFSNLFLISLCNERSSGLL